jgi:hypothetical protein
MPETTIKRRLAETQTANWPMTTALSSLAARAASAARGTRYEEEQ